MTWAKGKSKNKDLWYDYSFVRLVTNNSIYLLNRGRRQILTAGGEATTLSAFGYELIQLKNVSLTDLEKYDYDQTVPIVKQVGTSPDEQTRVHVLKAQILTRNPNLIHNLTRFGAYINPPIVIFRNVCMSLTGHLIKDHQTLSSLYLSLSCFIFYFLTL